MKKALLAVLAAAFCTTSAMAFPVSFGLKAGVALAKFSGTDADNLAQGMSTDAQATLKNKLSLVGGAGLSLGVGGAWSIGPEVLYVRKGTTINTPRAEGDVNLDYLEIPVLLKLNLIPSKTGLSPFIAAGPSLSLNTSANVKNPDGSTTDIKDMVNSSDFGFVFGGGVDVQKFTIEARYEVGLGNPVKSVGGYSPKIHNSTIYAMVGYKLF